MFCGNCGNEMSERDVFCGCCGFQMNAVVDSVPMKKRVKFHPLAKWNNHKSIKKAIALVLAATCTIGGTQMIQAYTGYRGMLNDICKTVNRRTSDLDTVVDVIAPEFASDEYQDIVDIVREIDTANDELSNVEESIEDGYDNLEDNFGRNAKISYKIIEEEKMNKSQLRRVEDTYEDYSEKHLTNFINHINDHSNSDKRDLANRYDLSKKEVDEIIESANEIYEGLENPDITEGYNLALELSVNGSRDDYKEIYDVRVIKMNGDWMIDYTSVDQLNQIFNQLGGYVNSLCWYF